jgi:Flavin containing amine oxidoreductase
VVATLPHASKNKNLCFVIYNQSVFFLFYYYKRMTHIYYDIIIVGGGIAGLYKAYNILKKKPNTSVLLLEATNRLGGRIYTYHDNTYKSIEAGAGRFHKKHKLLWNLIRELGLENQIIQISNKKQYIPVPGTIYKNENPTGNIDKVLQESKKTPIKTLQSKTFLEYAKQVLSKEQQDPNDSIKYILDSFGYSTELTDMNAYDTIQLIKKHYNQSNFFVLKGGMEQIITKLISKLETYPNFQYHLREPVIDIKVGEAGKPTVSPATPSLASGKEMSNKIREGGAGAPTVPPTKITTPKTTYICNICICGLIKEELQKIQIFQKIRPQLEGIKNLPLCRIYTKFSKDPKTNQVWFQDLPKMTTNNHLRYIIPINPMEGTIMVSYTDNNFARYWANMEKNHGIKTVNEMLQKQLQQIFPTKKIPKPTHTKIFYWEHGVAYFQRNFDSIKTLSKIRDLSSFGVPTIFQPFPEIPIYICGENYSQKNAQWVEGALE